VALASARVPLLRSLVTWCLGGSLGAQARRDSPGVAAAQPRRAVPLTQLRLRRVAPKPRQPSPFRERGWRVRRGPSVGAGPLLRSLVTWCLGGSPGARPQRDLPGVAAAHPRTTVPLTQLRLRRVAPKPPQPSPFRERDWRERRGRAVGAAPASPVLGDLVPWWFRGGAGSARLTGRRCRTASPHRPPHPASAKALRA